MTTYLIRRLLVMIPTIIGLTIVSFCVMQLAPGDPLQSSNSSGATGADALNRERYLIMKRDLRLDLPLLLNGRYFFDYRPSLEHCADFRMSKPEDLAKRIADGLPADQLKFVRSLDIHEFEASLKDERRHRRLAAEIRDYAREYCENVGKYGVGAAISLLKNPETDRRIKIGVVECLNHMVVEKHQYIFSKEPTAAEEPHVLSVWKLWWERNKKKFPPLDPERVTEMDKYYDKMLAAKSRKELFNLLEEAYFDREEMPYFAKKLLAATKLQEKVVITAILKLFVSEPLEMQAGNKATDKQLKELTENWQLHYDNRADVYTKTTGEKVSALLFDTQYAYMVRRLITFQFGRSATKTREPVKDLLWDAFIVSAPLMLMAQLIIYLVAVPIGVICAVNRGNAIDRGTSLALFFLYSIPPFVAGMVFLLFFCYGDYLSLFPMGRLHSTDVEGMSRIEYLVDYLKHAFLPVVCLSLFSLAAVAMYSRTSLLDVIGQDYIRTARAKGVPNWLVIFKHAFRNALIPVLTLFSNILPAMLGGSILIEYLFNIPGMGRLGFDSILRKDFPTLMSLLYIDAIVVLFSILLTDILYVFADPRISFDRQEGA